MSKWISKIIVSCSPMDTSYFSKPPKYFECKKYCQRSRWNVKPLIHEGHGYVDVVSEVAALRCSPALFIFRIGVVWPALVMRTSHGLFGVPGQRRVPCPWITAQPHRPLHSHCLLRLHLDCKSQALLTHLCCLSPRLMAITSVCFFSEAEENYKNQMLFWE